MGEANTIDRYQTIKTTAKNISAVVKNVFVPGYCLYQIGKEEGRFHNPCGQTRAATYFCAMMIESVKVGLEYHVLVKTLDKLL
jgi:hypothetical protein|tara:strand:- start:461 stop:709 length:249 start_codon:yes stop_codon:yes gene_type:complete